MHVSVLLEETIAALLAATHPLERVIDGTLGAGGHTQTLLERSSAQVLGIELDPQAFQLAQSNLAPYSSRVHYAHDSYLQMTHHAAALGWDGVDAILLDLGVSSMQLDTPERGFAFRHEGVLDMRFNPQDSTRPTAADLVNTATADELAQLFADYGEENHARHYARLIVQSRPFTTTTQLAEFIYQHVPRYKSKGKAPSIHPATRVFQALRIAVNEELTTVEQVLPQAMQLLRSGGRLAVITFHSLEDRIVKQAFKAASEEFIPPPGMASLGTKKATVRLITRKPIEPSAAEVEQNPRSRSAKLRVVEKL